MSKADPRTAGMRTRIRQSNAAEAVGKLIPRKASKKSVKGMDAESIALANNPKFVSIIEKSRAKYEAEGGMGLEDVRRKLGIPGKTRKRKAS